MHILHTYIYNYIFISHYHIVIVAQRSFQSFFAIFNFSVALSVLAKPFCRLIRFGTDCFRDWKVSKGHVKMVTFLYPLRTSLVSLNFLKKCIDSFVKPCFLLFIITHFCNVYHFLLSNSLLDRWRQGDFGLSAQNLCPHLLLNLPL